MTRFLLASLPRDLRTPRPLLRILLCRLRCDLSARFFWNLARMASIRAFLASLTRRCRFLASFRLWRAALLSPRSRIFRIRAIFACPARILFLKAALCALVRRFSFRPKRLLRERRLLQRRRRGRSRRDVAVSSSSYSAHSDPLTSSSSCGCCCRRDVLTSAASGSSAPSSAVSG